MSVEEQVDRLLQKKDEKVVVKHFKFNKRNFLIGFGSMVVTALLFTMLVVPVSREWMEEFFFGAREQTIAPSGGGTIVNDFITWSNDYGTLTVTPHTSTNIITQTQYANFTSNITNDIDIAFRFDDNIKNKDIWMWRNISHNVTVSDFGYVSANYTLYDITDVEVINESVVNASGIDFGDVPSDYYRRGNASYWNNEYQIWQNDTFVIGFDDFFPKPMNPDETTFFFEFWGQTGLHIEEQYWFDWKDVSGQFNHQLYNGKHYYYVSDVPVVQGKSYLFKWQYDIPLVNFKSSGKWDLMAKLHSDDIPTALSSGRYIMIDPWWNSEWLYSKKITIDSSQVGATLTNFPILFDNTSSDFSNAQVDGDDFAFLDSTNNSQYNHEIETYNSTSNRLIAWVNITTLAHDADTVLYLYYGNSSATSQQDVTGTWDTDYMMVNHFNGSSNITCLDSTSNNNDVTDSTGTPDYQQTGITGYGVGFIEGSSESLSVSDSASLDIASQELTIEAWFEYDISTAGVKIPLVSKWGTNIRSYQLYSQDNAGVPPLAIASAISEDGNWDAGKRTLCYKYEMGDPNDVVDTWFYLSTTFPEGGTELAYIYLNGSRVAEVDYESTASAIASTAARLNFGSDDDLNVFWTGIIDECRISDIKRSQDWMITTYNTIINSTTTFLSVGIEQSAPAWQIINNTYNGSLFNQSQISVISNTVNGSAYNQSQYSVINLTINGSVYNQTQFYVINNTYNGSLYNTSQTTIINNTYNGSAFNQSQYSVINNTINGSLYNLSGEWESGMTVLGLSTNNEINESISWNATSVNLTTQDVFCNSSGFRSETVQIDIVTNDTVNVSEIQAWCSDLNNSGNYINASNMTLWVSGDNSTWAICGDNYWGFGDGVFPDSGGNLSINASTWDGVGDSPFVYYGDGTFITANCSIYLRWELDLFYIDDFTPGNYTNSLSEWNWWWLYIANYTWIFYDEQAFNGTFNYTADVTGLNTTVDTITPYNQTASPLAITVTSHNETPDNITLWYRHSTDNSTWGETGESYTIGHSVVEATIWGLSDDVAGVFFTNNNTESGYADNMTVYFRNQGGGNVSAALYYRNLTLVPNGATDTYDFGVEGSYSWHVLNFSGTKPYVESGVQYALCFGTDGTNTKMEYVALAGDSFQDDQVFVGGINWVTLTEDDTHTRNASIYLSYAESAGTGWTNYTTDTASPWNWSFNFPNGTGYYEFYSIANLSGQANESAPSYNDTLCYFDLAVWSVFNNTINGTIYNGSAYSIINNTINGTVYNGTGIAAAWQVINNTINGSLYNISAADLVGYYVANAGNDSNSGTSPATAWKTIGKVNDEMTGVINQSDDIYFNRGDTWSENTYIEPRLGGTLADPMIFGAYGTGVKPIITNAINHGLTGNRMDNLGHFIFENLNFSDCGNEGVNIADLGTHNLTFRNLEVWNAADYGILLRYVQTFKIENCDILSVGTSGIALSGNAGGTGNIAYGKMWNITTTGGAKDGIALHYRNSEADYVGSNHWIENFTADNFGEAGLDITVGTNPSANVYVNNTRLTNCSQAGVAAGHSTQNETYQNIFIDDCTDNFIASRDKNLILRKSVIRNPVDDNVVVLQGVNSYVTSNITIYQNTFIGEASGENFVHNIQDDLGNSRYSRDNTFKNNIFYSIASSSGVFVDLDTALATIRSNYTYNMWWCVDGATGNQWDNAGSGLNFAGWISQSEVNNELLDDPELDIFNDYELNSTSPCIDTGDWLTFTVGTGTNEDWVTVDRSEYFFDGYDFDDLSGDKIFVGSNIGLEIIEMNYYNDTFQVNRSITWGDGDAVSLTNYSGSAPDIGAREYTAATYWQSISSTINGTVYNISVYLVINNTYNGSLFNQSQYSEISNTYNGSLWNVSTMHVFSDTYNGSIYNLSVYSLVNSTINGSLYNGTIYRIINNTYNGSLWNVSVMHIFSNTINGIIYNLSDVYKFVNNSINGSIFNVSQDPFIDNVYPANESNILVVQPTVYFNLTSPLGYTMNYSVWIGSSSGNCNTLIYSGTNVANGTQFDSSQVYYLATEYTTYHWRISANDGTVSINETYHFKIYVERTVMTPGFEIIVFAASILICLFIIKRRKKNV